MLGRVVDDVVELEDEPESGPDEDDEDDEEDVDDPEPGPVDVVDPEG